MRQETLVMPYSGEAIAYAAKHILAGQPVAVPTETVYGLAADATNPDAVMRIFEAKGRPSCNPLIVHVIDLAAAEELVVFSPQARALAKKHWPGPLTLVLPSRPDNRIAPGVTANLTTLAVRVPAQRAMRSLLKEAGRPLAAPSANPSGSISPTTTEHVRRGLEDRVSLIIDDGPTELGIESTIIGFTDGQAKVLRLGSIVADFPFAASASITASGQLESHYAPSKPVRLNATERRGDEWLIGFGDVAGDDTLSSSGSLEEAAAKLYAALHRADRSDRSKIGIAPIPAGGIGDTIRDRIKRAAHPA